MQNSIRFYLTAIVVATIVVNAVVNQAVIKRKEIKTPGIVAQMALPGDSSNPKY